MKLREHNIRLTGESITLRPMTENDWDILVRWGSDPEALWFSEGDHVAAYTLKELQEIYRGICLNAFCFIIEFNGRTIGNCWLQEMNLRRIIDRYPAQDCRRIDIVIGEKDCWGKGYGSDAIGVLVRFGFEEQCADLIFGCDIADYNPRSRRAFEKIGFREDGREEHPPGAKGKWSSDLVMGRDEYQAEMAGAQSTNR